MPPARDLGERLSALEAQFTGFEKYTHERWHDLNNTLTPLANLPERITRDVAKMQGTFDGKLGAISKEIDRSITTAIEKAISPMNEEIAKLRTDVDALKLDRQQFTGARRFGVWIVQTVIAAIAAAVAVLGMGRHP